MVGRQISQPLFKDRSDTVLHDIVCAKYMLDMN